MAKHGTDRPVDRWDERAGKGVPNLSVVIPTLNRPDSLRACLSSLEGQTMGDFEVLIIDGGPGKETRAVIEEFSQRVPICLETYGGGLVSSANRGLGLARGKIVSRIDDDVVLSPGWAAAVVSTFEADRTVGGVSGPTIIPEEFQEGRDLTYFNRRISEARGFIWRILKRIYHGFFMEGEPLAVGRFFRSGAFSLGSNFKKSSSLAGPIQVDYLEACNMSMRRDLVEQVGGFDPKYVGVGEYHEPDMAFKIKNIGYRLVFIPEARLDHRPSVAGIFAARPKMYGRIQNFILFYYRHIRPDSLDKIVRFGLYLLFMNAYFIVKFAITGNARVLGGIAGTLVGLVKYLPELSKSDV
jgi:glycosyltransferase involved in cell wall biosynthesis